MSAIVTFEDFTGRINIDTHSIAIQEQLNEYAVDAQERIFKDLFNDKDYDVSGLSSFEIKKMIACKAYCNFVVEYKAQATASGEKKRETVAALNSFNVSKYVTAYNDFVSIYNEVIDVFIPATDLPVPCKLNYVNRFGI